jgi:hypothetical protein
MGKKFPRKNKISLPTGMRPAAIASTIIALKTGYISDSVSVYGLEDKEMKKKREREHSRTAPFFFFYPN